MPSTIFYDIISQLVYKHMKLKGLQYRDIAILLAKQEGYIRKIHSQSTKNRYNLEHLSLLSHEWNVSINEFIPTVETIAKLPAYRNLDLQERIDFINIIYENLRGE